MNLINIIRNYFVYITLFNEINNNTDIFVLYKLHITAGVIVIISNSNSVIIIMIMIM